MKNFVKLSVITLTISIAASAQASVKSYNCDEGIKLQIQMQDTPGFEFAEGVTVSGPEQSLNGRWHLLGDGIFFTRSGGDRLMLDGSLYKGQDSGTLSVQDVTVACEAVN